MHGRQFRLGQMHTQNLRHGWRDLAHIDFSQISALGDALAFHEEGRVKLWVFGKIAMCAPARDRNDDRPRQSAAAAITQLPRDNESHSRIGKASSLNRFVARQYLLDSIFRIAGGFLQQSFDLGPGLRV